MGLWVGGRGGGDSNGEGQTPCGCHTWSEVWSFEGPILVDAIRLATVRASRP